MSLATADIVVNAGDSIEFIFIPEAGGLTSLSTASVLVVSTDIQSALSVSSNNATFAAPPGAPASDSIVQLVLLLGPTAETGSLSFRVNGGASTEFFASRPLFNPIIQINLFGK